MIGSGVFEPARASGASVAAVQAAELRRGSFHEPVAEPPEPDHSDWIMLVMLLSILPKGNPGYRRHFVQGGEALGERIVKTVAEAHGLEVAQLESECRATKISHPRQMAMYLMYRYAGLSHPIVARRFGKDHTTSMHAIKSVQYRVDNLSTARAMLEQIKAKLELT